ncbi:MAG: serine/threonine protein kinase [Phycisphaerales bacterium]|nr:serine/threonine protein kinase [Phycisphaerae bacterium]NNF41832.1 serine/threonine protein kinase [Phycisphaerales bacterium]NNM25935.1 serine/threonine protein kinase [Phycisphaerales bacterium]
MPDRPKPTDPPANEDEPILQLSDSSHGSTLPVGAETPADSADSADRADASGASPGDSEGGGTTGGFETLLGKVVVAAGLVTKEEVDLCNAMLESGDREEDPRTLMDMLVDRDFATQHQLDRLRQDFEAKKSGQHIPGFRIKRKLGSGAMATVFLARQLSLDRLVAIKILPKKFSDNAKFIERFYKEGRSAAQLNHPNIVGAYDVGRAGEHHYFVMEFVNGPTIHQLIQKHKRMPERQAIDIVKQVAKALEHAHGRGFVHRDMKPKNIMVTEKGVVKLADLGLARAITDEEAARAEAGRAYGTPYYISPEQIRGELNIGPPADIYGLGATFYHMVTGRVPFEGKNPSEVMHRHLKSPLEPPDHVNPSISAGCAQVIEMMMAKKASERYHDATDLLEDLDLVSSGQPPHFAHRGLDHVAVTEVLTDVVESSPRTVDSGEPPSVFTSPLVMALLAVLALSLLINILMIVLLVSG